MPILSNIDFEFYTILTLVLIILIFVIWKSSNFLIVMYGYCVFAVMVIFSFSDSLFKKINNFSYFVSFLGKVIYPFISSNNYNPAKVYLFFKTKIFSFGTIDYIFTNSEPLTKAIIDNSFEPKYSENLITILMKFKSRYRNYDEKEFWHQIYFGENAVLGKILKEKIQNFDGNAWRIETIDEKLNFLKHHIFNDFKTWNLDFENIPYLSLAIEKLENIRVEITKKAEPIQIPAQVIVPKKIEKPVLKDYFKEPNDIAVFKNSIELLKNTEFEGFKNKKLPENYFILVYNIFEALNYFNEKWPRIKNNKKRKLELLDPIFGKTISRGYVNDLLAEYEENNAENKVFQTQMLMKLVIENFITT